jgi:deoxyribonuclease-4
MSIAGGIERALLRGKTVGCRVIQIFTRNRIQWKGKELNGEEIDAFHRAREETSVLPVSVHGSYLINLASPSPDVYQKSCECILHELDWAHRLGIPYLVIHPGAHKGNGSKRGIRRISEAIDRSFDRFKGEEIKVLLETTSGQGTSIGHRFEELAEILNTVRSPERMGVCVDTCHVFSAGYDLRTSMGCVELFDEFERTIGLDRLRLFHINDSKRGVGTKIDRHEHPGRGCIGEEAFSFMLNDPRFWEIPFLLETPKGKDENGVDLDQRNIRFLMGLKSE